MSEAANKWAMGGGAIVLLIIALPIWREFHEPSQTIWNVFLAVLLIGLVVCVFFLQRYFRAHIGEIGEARFDTRNQGDPNG